MTSGTILTGGTGEAVRDFFTAAPCREAVSRGLSHHPFYTSREEAPLSISTATGTFPLVGVG
jgi:hypothetical protein